MQAGAITRRGVDLLLALLASLPGMPDRARAETPLAHCYAEADDRLDVKPCLEARLQRAETLLRDAEATADEAMQALAGITGRDDAARALADAKAAFVRYRETHCRWLRERAEPGTGAGDIELDCRVRITEARVAELRADDPPGGVE